MGKTFAFEMIGRVVLWVGTSQPPSRSEWDAYVDAMKRHVATHRDACSFVWSEGTGPSTVQRKQMNEAGLPPSMPIAIILTNLQNPIARGVATAISWFLPATRLFGPGDEAAAARHLGLSELERQSVIRALVHHRVELAAQRAAAG
jgi:hypothetical protein